MCITFYMFVCRYPGEAWHHQPGDRVRRFRFRGPESGRVIVRLFGQTGRASQGRRPGEGMVVGSDGTQGRIHAEEPCWGKWQNWGVNWISWGKSPENIMGLL